MKKRLISMFLVIAMVMGMLPTNVFAAETGDGSTVIVDLPDMFYDADNNGIYNVNCGDQLIENPTSEKLIEELLKDRTGTLVVASGEYVIDVWGNSYYTALAVEDSATVIIKEGWFEQNVSCGTITGGGFLDLCRFSFNGFDFTLSIFGKAIFRNVNIPFTGLIVDEDADLIIYCGGMYDKYQKVMLEDYLAEGYEFFYAEYSTCYGVQSSGLDDVQIFWDYDNDSSYDAKWGDTAYSSLEEAMSYFDKWIFVSGGDYTLDEGIYESSTWVKNGKITINGGIFESFLDLEPDASHGQRVEVTVNGGTFKGHFNVYSGAKATITGGNFERSCNINDGAEAIITGGNFERFCNIDDGAEAIITGGTFTKDCIDEGFLINYIAEGYKAKDNGDNTYTVVPMAISDITVAANENGTVTVPASATEDETIELIVTPAEGYLLDSLTVVDAEGNSVKVTGNTFVMPDSAVTITVQFVLKEYEVKFYDFDGTKVKTETVKHGHGATAPADPERTGYTFMGWDKAFDNVTDNLEVVAQYQINSYKVLFLDWNGDVLKEETVVYGRSATAPSDPERIGYSFMGWDKDFIQISDNLEVTAVYEVNEYEITIPTVSGGNVETDKDSPIMGDEVTVTVTPEIGKEIDQIVIKDENGKEIEVTEKEDGTYTYEQPAGDVTIEVTMKDSEFEVEIEKPTDGKIETDKDSPIMGDEVTVTVTPEIGKEIDQIIIKDENGKEIEVTEKEDGTYTYEQPAGDVTITVRFKLKQYTVKFIDWDEKILKTETVEHGFAATAPSAPARTGYTFTGWDLIFNNIIGDLTVQAQYTINLHEIIYKVDGVVYHTLEDVAYGTVITLIEAPGKIGYTFSGWSTAPETMPDEDVTIEGSFSINAYTIAFQTNGGSAVEAIRLDYNTAVAAPAAPTKTGFDFGGWFADTDLTEAYVFSTMPAQNITVYAKWEEATGTAYTVKHYHQNASGEGYTLYESETLHGITNAVTAAQAKDYTGFTAAKFEQVTIVPDGSAVVEIKYDRNIYTVSLNPNMGKIIEGDVKSYTYGVGAKLPENVIRSGYIFGGWFDNEECTGTAVAEISAADLGNKVFYAKWTIIEMPVVTPSYPPIVNRGENGTVVLDPKAPETGDTVIITVVPDEGYEVDEVVITDKNGREVPVTDNGDGSYSFVQPSAKVYVDVTFVVIQEEPEMVFVDVPDDAYYTDAVAWAVKNGITNGTSATTFSPNMTCTRGQAVTFLWRAAGSPEPKSSVMPFQDVKAGTSYYKAVLWAVENGITNGTSATAFSPKAECTRGQIVTFLWRAQKASEVNAEHSFTDVNEDAYYFDALLWAVDNGITNGTTATTFSPSAKCTRAQIVTFLYRCLGDQ